MGRRSDIIAGLGGATPALRRYARALCAGAGQAVADDLLQSALQSVGARIRSRDLRPADLAEARIETYATLVAFAEKKLAGAPGPASRHPPIVHGLAGLGFDERAVLLLVSLEGFGYDAAARIVGATRETALARLMRARAALGAEGLRPVAPLEGGRRAASHLRVVK
ncbi:MAG: sigma factor-like helix-turn-helix DNA-binding protein [Methylocystis sp.]